jgi:hypothetical protein
LPNTSRAIYSRFWLSSAVPSGLNQRIQDNQEGHEIAHHK